MPSFLPDLTSRYLCNESSGDLLDSAGPHDLDSTFVATYNGESVSLDGIGDLLQWAFANVPMTASNDFTGYIDMTIDNDFDTVQKYFLNPTSTASLNGPFLRFRGDGGRRQVDFASHFGAGGIILELLTGRLFNIGERVIMLFSYNHTTKTAALVVKSDDGSDPLDLDDSGVATVNPAWTGVLLTIFKRFAASDFTEGTINEMGFIDGTARSIADMQDTADELLLEAEMDPEQARRRGLIILGGGARS